MSTKYSLKITTIILFGLLSLLIIAVPALILLNQPASDNLATISDREADAKQKDYLKKYPIINELPIIYAHYDDQYNYTEFRIDGGEFAECSQEFCLKITDITGNNYILAKELIAKTGYNPDDYELIYELQPIIPLQ